MRPYLWSLVSIWGTWLVALVAASVYADVSADGNAVLAPYLVLFLGIAVAVVLSVLVIVSIAGAQCLVAADRRTAERREQQST